MQCHVTIAKEKPSIQKLAEYFKSKQAIPWVRVYTVLPGVAWNHRVHLEAGVKCESCHGQVAQMDEMSEVTSVTTMYSCLNCHEINRAKTACDTCHKP
jgi:c(7)-type cytochrome triheme protein